MHELAQCKCSVPVVFVVVLQHVLPSAVVIFMPFSLIGWFADVGFHHISFTAVSFCRGSRDMSFEITSGRFVPTIFLT